MLRSARERVFESLEARQMLAGHALMAAGLMSHANDHAVSAVTRNLNSEHNILHNIQSQVQATILTGTLSDTANASVTGQVFYSSMNIGGTTRNFMIVNVSGATPNTDLTVSVDGTNLGTISTNASGSGQLILSSNPQGTQQSFPTGFPTLMSGDTVKVGTATATLNSVFSVGGDDGDEMETTLSARLTDPNNSAVSGKVVFTTETEDGATESRLAVSIRGATANTTLDVTVDGTVIGQITTDARGNGRLVFSSNPEGSQLPLPTGVTLDTGSTVSVGTATGTLALVASAS